LSQPPNATAAPATTATETPPAARASAEPCPVCGGATSLYTERAAHGGTWRLYRCGGGGCGHGTIVPRPTPAQLDHYYTTVKPPPHRAGSHPTDHPDARDLARQVRRLGAPSGGRSLDVGCGDAAFSYHLQAIGYAPTLIDLAPESVEYARRVSGAEFERVGFEAFAAPAGAFSVILMSQVLEHAIDPAAWLAKAAALLAPGGLLVVAVPNFAGAYRALGARDPFITPPEHLNHFTPRSLARAMRDAGLDPVRMRHRSRVSLGGGLPRRWVGAGWNAVARPVVDRVLRRGIILQGFARKPAMSPPPPAPDGPRMAIT
jgi:SAM-dependent methyltransferase